MNLAGGTYLLCDAIRRGDRLIVGLLLIGLACMVVFCVIVVRTAIKGRVGVPDRTGRSDPAEDGGGGSEWEFAATVCFSGGTLSLYDRLHHPGSFGSGAGSGVEGYLRLLDDAVDRGAAVASNGRILLVVLDGPDDDFLPAELRVSRDPSDPAVRPAPGTNAVAIDFPSGGLVFGSGSGVRGREADVPPGEYEVTVNWRTVGPHPVDGGKLESISFVLRPITPIPSWAEGPIRLRMESDRTLYG